LQSDRPRRRDEVQVRLRHVGRRLELAGAPRLTRVVALDDCLLNVQLAIPAVEDWKAQRGRDAERRPLELEWERVVAVAK
jgi:hypothetical protein